MIHNKFAPSMKQFFSSPASSFNTQAIVAKTLYRQILKWTNRTGIQVPFDPIPPFTLMPPRVNSTAIKLLALEIQNGTKKGIPSKNRVNPTSSLDDDSIVEKIRYIAKKMPANTIVNENRVVIPIRNAGDVKNTARMVYKLNSIASPDSDHDLLDHIKDRVSLGFQLLKSLNQLSIMLDERKESRQKHLDREGVFFHVGQVVQHKTKRWRAVVVGWQKELSNSKHDNPQKTSLTLKAYQAGARLGGEDVSEMDVSLDAKDSMEVEYILHLDEADAAFTRTRVLGSIKAKQHELDIVSDNDLKRVRNLLIKHQFTGFDPRIMEFVPTNVLQYEYPVDQITDIHKDSADILVDTEYDLAKHENAKIVLDGVKSIASKLHRIILDESSCARIRNLHILFDLEQKLQAVIEGEIQENIADYFSSDDMSSHKLAVKYMTELVNISVETSNILWQRNRSKEYKDRIRFPLGSVVKHKKYGFRGGKELLKCLCFFDQIC